MTYNIGYLSGMANNKPVREKKFFFQNNMKNTISLLNTVRPDFIAFQEIDFNSHRSYFINQVNMIAKQSKYKYAAIAINWNKRYVPFPYWPPSVHFKRMLSGQVILSRYPIVLTKRIVLQKIKNRPFYYSAFYLDRLAQIAEVKIHKKVLIIINVHLEAFEKKTRESQAQTVLDIYKGYKDKYPVLLIGDFNCVPPSATKKNGFQDDPEQDFYKESTIGMFLKERSLREAILDSEENKDETSTFTFPTDNPSRKLDYIFYTHQKIKFLKGKTPKIDSSDHLPLMMIFQLKE